MATNLNPYISFKNDARQAMEFYQSVFGGKLTSSTFSENGMTDNPAEADKLMHGMLVTDGGMVLMGADTPNSMAYNPGARISVSLSGDNEAELRGYYDKLVDGGLSTVPLETAPWGDTFGMCVDKFGVAWMVNITGQATQQNQPVTAAI